MFNFFIRIENLLKFQRVYIEIKCVNFSIRMFTKILLKIP